VILLATAIMLTYPLTEKAFRHIVTDLAQRRGASVTPTAAGAQT
jgi:Na+/melibiose symporter-like transporter